MITRFSASAWSTALIDFSLETESGTMMNGKITRSLSGSTGRTSGIFMAFSFACSFGSVICSLFDDATGDPTVSAMAVPVSRIGRISRLLVARYLLHVAPAQTFAREQRDAGDDHRQRADDVKQDGGGHRVVDVESVKRFQQPLADLVESAHAAGRGDGQSDRGHRVDQERRVVGHAAAQRDKDDPQLRGEA